jgi:serine/threonine-protein kinase
LALSPGDRLGAYEILSLLGAGGMGEVYRARDTKLKRDVAIKVLPDLLASDPERLARFQREAELLATLNHPHIAAIYGFEDSGATHALVLELVEGPMLADRIAKGPIPLDEALPIARQIAEALEAAHEQGIIHRDLKPSNVKLRPDGVVKVLDFGLAKAMEPSSAVSPMITVSPTITTPAQMTGVGMILGTAAYMSPEQAKGQNADKRCDIWAFGCVLYEMLSGRAAFAGDSVPDTIVAVVTTDPDWARLPPAATPLRPLIAQCLVKDPRERLRDIGDARIALTNERWTESSKPAVALAKPGGRGWRVALPATTLLIAAMAAFVMWPRSASAPQPVARALLDFPQYALSGARLGNLIALSPDGTRLVYVGNPEGKDRLYVRQLDQFESTPLGGTDGAIQPFFSPDGTSVGFFADGKLKTTALAGGSPITVANAPDPFGGAWADDHTIVFAPTTTGLMRVNERGGPPTQLTQIPPSGVLRHAWPTMVPGTSVALFTVVVNSTEAGINAVSLPTGQVTPVLPRAAGPEFADRDHLIYADPSSGALSAVRFDGRRGQTVGSPVVALEGVWASGSGAAQFSVSRSGSLIYLPNTFVTQRSLVWVDRTGRTAPLLPDIMPFGVPRLSPDGRRLAFITYDGLNPSTIWLHDFANGRTQRVQTEGRINTTPEWSLDGKRIAFVSVRDASRGRQSLFVFDVDTDSPPELVAPSEGPQQMFSWAPGNVLVYGERHSTDYDIFRVNLDGERRRTKLVATPGDDLGAAVSPDGRYIAYSSNHSSRMEVYVTPFPGPGPPMLVSTDGGAEPAWSTRGELFYRHRDKMMVVRVQTAPTFAASRPETLFEGRFEVSLLTPGFRFYDVQPDGQRFVMVRSDTVAPPRQLRLVVNWTQELNRLLASP